MKFLLPLLLFCSTTMAATQIVGPALIEDITSTATAAGTTTLTKASNTNQAFTGVTTQTVVLPNATTLLNGRRFYIANRSSGTVTVNYNGGSLAKTLTADTQATLVLKDNSSSAGTWDVSSGGGTVTSVALTVPSEFSVAGSPIATNGTLAITAVTQTANTVYAGPTSGGAAAPGYRSLVVADLPASWLVDATVISSNSSNCDLGTSDITDFASGSISVNANLVLTSNGSVTAQITCDSTQAPSGTTCGGGANENLGVAFTVSDAAWYEACVDFSHLVVTGASGALDATFQLVETAQNSQTIIQEGKSRTLNRYGTASQSQARSMHICGTFSLTAGNKAIRLVLEQDATATLTTNLIIADADAATGQRNIHWTVKRIP